MSPKRNDLQRQLMEEKPLCEYCIYSEETGEKDNYLLFCRKRSKKVQPTMPDEVCKEYKCF